MSGLLLAMALSVSWFRNKVTFFVIILVRVHNSVIIIITLIIMLWWWKEERRKCGVQCVEEGNVCAGQWQNEALRWAWWKDPS